MQKLNILKLMYNLSPLNFYTISKGKTTIKSINNTSLGYKFDKEFSPEEITSVWFETKLHKRFSTIFIFIIFISLLYEIIFPQFSFLVNNTWYVNAVIMLVVIAIVCQFSTVICTKVYEKRLKKKFGEFEKAIFVPSAHIDDNYYNLFKSELVKALVILIVLIIGIVLISPFTFAKRLLDKGNYNQVIKITTLGAKAFPIAQEWYSMRGYANYKMGNYDEAIKDYTQAYKLGADGFNIMNFDNKIFIKYIKQDYESAIKDFDKEIKKSDTENEKDQFLWDKAQFLYNIGQYEDALSVYNELIDKAENDRVFLLKDRLYLERAQVNRALGKTEEAHQDIEASGADTDLIYNNPIPKPVLIVDEKIIEQP